MALDLNLKVSKEDFQRCIEKADAKMSALDDCIDRYDTAKRNLDQFIEQDDINYQAMVARLDQNIKAAKKQYSAVKKQKDLLQETVSKMEGMGSKVQQTLETATEATGSAINAALKIDEVL